MHPPGCLHACRGSMHQQRSRFLSCSSHLAAVACRLQEDDDSPLGVGTEGGDEAPEVSARWHALRLSREAAAAGSRGLPGGRPVSSRRAAVERQAAAERDPHCACLPSSSAPPSSHVSAMPASCRLMPACHRNRHPCWSCSELRRQR